MRRSTPLLAALWSVACGSPDVAPLPPPPECQAGYVLTDGVCSAAGMTAAACPEGFAFAADVCLPILPGDCAPGTMALPGEPACRLVSPCADGQWGDIPSDANTQHVDAAHLGPADGSATMPWPTIGDAITAAAPGATIAIARGSYVEGLNVTKPVVLWGVCPSETLITSVAAQTIVFRPGSSGSVLRNIGVVDTGGIGVLVSGADVSIEAAWIYQTADIGVVAELTLGPASVTVSDSLIEGFGRYGMQSLGAGMFVRRSVVRTPAASGRGAGIWLQGHDGVRTQGEVIDSLVDRVRFVGVLASAADVSVERTAVIGTMQAAEGLGWGLLSQAQPETGERASLTVRQSAIVDSHQLGVSVAGGEARLEHVSVVGGTGGAARGVEAEDSNGVRAILTMIDSTVAESQELGILCGGSDVVLERVQVRNVHAGINGELGRGIGLQTNASTLLPTVATVSASLVRDNSDVGVLVANSVVQVTETGIYTTGPRQSDGAFGDGIAVVTTDPSLRALLTLHGATVSDNARGGVSVFGATLEIGHSTLACNAFDLNSEELAGSAPEVVDLGENQCGCESEEACKAVSAQITPPDV